MKRPNRKTRLREAGFSSYNAYLKSSYWKQFVKAYFADTMTLKICFVCGDEEVQLHHWTYRSVPFEESFFHILPLCRVHHRWIHKTSKARSKKPGRFSGGYLTLALEARRAFLEGEQPRTYFTKPAGPPGLRGAEIGRWHRDFLRQQLPNPERGVIDGGEPQGRGGRAKI